jgi:hypothetical protein
MKLQVNLIFEIMGRPPEHVKQSLTNLVMKIASDKGVKLIGKEIHEPVKIENSKDLFSSFAEVSLELDSIANYLQIIFNYMPAHIELVRPEEITFTNRDLNEMANALAQKMHQYDAIAKNSMIEKDILMKKLYEVAPHLFKKPDGSVPDINRVVEKAKEDKKESKKSGKKGKKK